MRTWIVSPKALVAVMCAVVAVVSPPPVLKVMLVPVSKSLSVSVGKLNVFVAVPVGAVPQTCSS